ncbi:hypothetical protein CYMTET_29294 [Cymbomonas tetramitiformis]|uniref:Uncharacterized protein n=1 Tax=Cymbomonas tetramitiformis TaxID=36881 RepID=A0AAE0FLA0_9CHLO|nr:hypothetical protein CYMTET_29294 [Cymbomonas tetramitiformis]
MVSVLTTFEEVCYAEDAKGPNKEQRRMTYSDIRMVWSQLFQETLGPLPKTIHNDCCAQFAVTRDRIWLRSKSFYARCYDWLLSASLPPERSGRVFEQLWRLIFSAGTLQVKDTSLMLPC